MPPMSTPYFFGYGSLVNRDTHLYRDCHRAELRGWRRAWVRTAERETVFLSVRMDPESAIDGLIAAGRQRLRPIFLTTITTVLGLTPLMLEQSFQAKFLIPMAISVAFGLMSATVLILLVLPCIIVIVDDLKAAGHFLWHGRRRTPAGPSAALEAELESS